MTAAPVDQAGPVEYTLTELSEVTGVPPRTIRYYQSNGLLPRPGRRGNQAIYSDEHLNLLRSVAELQAEGLRLQTIRSMLNGDADAGASVVDLLGPNLSGSAWLRTSARTLDEGELADLLGEPTPSTSATWSVRLPRAPPAPVAARRDGAATRPSTPTST